MALRAASTTTDAEWNVRRQMETSAFTTLVKNAKLMEERI